MLNVEIKNAEGQVVGVFMANPQEFKTGSTGFRAFGKMTIDGVKHQVNINIVKIGSKKEHEVELKEKKSNK